MYQKEAESQLITGIRLIINSPHQEQHKPHDGRVMGPMRAQTDRTADMLGCYRAARELSGFIIATLLLHA
ncbi:unnamed protein product [Boreogadus saida]